MTAAEIKYVNEITVRERSRLLNFIRKRVRDQGDAEDILQDVLYQFLVGFEDIRSTERVTSWLFTVARNRITDYFRKSKPVTFSSREIRQQGENDENPLMLEDIIPAIGRDPEDEYMREIIWEAIEEALGELPEEQMDVFVMNEFDDLSFREIADITGIGINTLLSRKRYAVSFLRKKLKELYSQL